MKKLSPIVILVALGAFSAWWLTRPPAPKAASVVTVHRKTLVSTIVTNGRAEPSEQVEVRAQAAGTIVRVTVIKGASVALGAMLMELDSATEHTRLLTAQASLAQANADLRLVASGGAAGARAELDGLLDTTRLQLDSARREADRTARLVKRDAETPEALLAAQNRVRQLEADLQSLDRRRQALVPPGVRQAAAARVRDAESAVALANHQLAQTRIVSPLAGIVYNLPVRRGAYVQPGDLMAEVGQTRAMRVRLYVDEPELGRVSKGMPVAIRWDALPGRVWPGKVETLPVQISALNNRQVGEVVCLIDNADLALPPGANIDAEIRSAVAENVLTIPKAALRRGDQGSGVLLVVGDHVEFRPVELGISSITDSEVRAGLKEGDRIAIPSDTALEPGDRVTAQP